MTDKEKSCKNCRNYPYMMVKEEDLDFLVRKNIVSKDFVYEKLRYSIMDLGKEGFADKHQISVGYVDAILDGSKPIGKKIAKMVGFDLVNYFVEG